ncbi:MAG TPA: class I SAM-dependent methyltransferase, partial [Bacteroidia bacterium]|nr:class I SAM-dependent methyltransferase [Bacteroidia bacterium]
MSTITLTHSSSFCERIVLGILAKMRKGRLDLQMPDGQILCFGNGEGGIHADLSILDADFFRRCVLYGDIGFGEAYVDGLWYSDSVTDVVKWFLLNIDSAPNLSGGATKSFLLGTFRLLNKLTHLKRGNTLEGARKNISSHYDLSNDFFSLWLDPTMTYSGAFFASDDMSLREAQVAKYDRLAHLMKLKPQHHVLEIGSGWGGNAIHMAEKYGCKVTSITISGEQQKLAAARVEEAG